MEKAAASNKDDAVLQASESHMQQSQAMNAVTNNARIATQKEHQMSLWQGIRLYPKAVAWSMLISTCICMEGYDVCLLSNFCEPHSLAATNGASLSGQLIADIL